MPTTQTKPWYLSKTVIAVIIGIAASLLAYITKNPAIGAGIEAESGNITSMIMQIIAVVSGVVALIGRLVASAKLTK